MSKIKSCQCGNNVRLSQEVNTCRICSTVYDQSGKMLLSRHNWNIRDYFCSFEKIQLNRP